MATFDPSSREREAHAEIVATRVAPRTARALVATVLAFAALGLGLELAALMRGASSLSETWAPPAAAPGLPALAWNREAVARLREIDDRVDQRSALARALRPWGQVALTALARYGNEEAYVGRRDWLVYRPDFDHLTGRGYLDRRPGDPVAAIAGFAADLERRGVRLLLVPVPAKPAVHPESLAEDLPDEAPRNVDDATFATRLRTLGAGMLDPLDLLRSAALDEPAYLATDTHWRPAAMDQVARETAIRLRALVDLPVGDDAALREEPGRVEGVGDTAALLELPAGVRRFAPERVETRRVIRADGTPWRPERGAPVLLLGDSFAAIYSQAELGFGAGAGFAERLSFHLGLPVDRILRNAGGASATRAALAEELVRDPRRLDGVRAVVWQLAARELSEGDWRAIPLPAASTPAGDPPGPAAGTNGAESR